MTSDSIQLLAGQAEKAFRAGKFAQAAKLYEQAAQSSANNADASRTAEIRNNWSVALLQSGDAAGALEAAQGTDLVFKQAGDIRRQALALGNQAAAHEALGQIDEALAYYRECSEYLKKVGDTEYRAIVLKSISALQMRTGHHLEALATMDAALTDQPKPSVKERFLKKLIHIPFKMLGRG